MRTRIARFPLRLISLAILAAVVSTFCACSSEESDPCDDTKKTEIEPLFRITWHITSALGDPYNGVVTVTSEKHYCDKTVKGHFVFDGTAVDGYYTGPTTQYKLANTKDYVFYQITTGSSVFVHNYYYNEAFQMMELIDLSLYVQDTIECTIPLP